MLTNNFVSAKLGKYLDTCKYFTVKIIFAEYTKA